MKPFPLSILSLLVLFYGCASMTPEECLQANWEEVGYNDAVEGYSASRSSDHQKACAEVGVTLDFQIYRSGYMLGLPYYCTPTTGFETADHGGDFAVQCDLTTFPEYAAGYAQGREIFLLKSEINQVTSQIRDRHRQAEALMSQIKQLTSSRDKPELAKKESRQLEYQISQLKELYRSLSEEIVGLENNIDVLEDEANVITTTFYGSL